MLRPNTSDQMDMSLIPTGTYPSEITAVEAQRSKKGNEMIQVTCSVQVENGKPPREGVLTWLVTEGKGSGGFDGLLRAVGLEALADQFKRGESVDFDEQGLIGQKPKVRIEHEEYDSEIRHRISKFLKA